MQQQATETIDRSHMTVSDEVAIQITKMNKMSASRLFVDGARQAADSGTNLYQSAKNTTTGAVDKAKELV